MKMRKNLFIKLMVQPLLITDLFTISIFDSPYNHKFLAPYHKSIKLCNIALYYIVYAQE